MNEENNNSPKVDPNPQSDKQGESVVPLSRSGGEKVIQPSEGIKQEIQAQQAQPQPLQPPTPVSQTPSTNPVSSPVNIYPDPPSGQIQAGMSASQLGLHESRNKFNSRQFIIKGIVGIVVIGVIFAILVMTNMIALSEFKNMGYTNSKGTNYKLDFYTKHGSKQLQSGNMQLVSKVSKDGKFPITLSISSTDETSGYNRVKDCSSFTKVFDVQSSNLNQKISVCDFGKQGNLPSDGVYIAGFMYSDKAHIITIGQDYGNIDLSSQSRAQQSLTKFGMVPYKDDIERIVSSIKVK